jgi:homoserine dehydrogenase
MRENNLTFDVALKQAQELGYAEADPTFDVEGISQLKQKDIAYAEELGYRIKLLAITKAHSDAVEIRVHPTLIPEKRLVANVNGPMNAVLVKGNMVGPTLYYGAGAGAEPTASAVVADVIDIVRQCKHGHGTLIPTLGFTKENIKKKKLLAIEEVESEFYLRLSMKNKTGLLANITNIFADKGVSIDAMVHKEIQDNNLDPDIFLVTSKVKEQTINEIISKIESLPENKDKIIKIRIEELNK